MSLDIKTFYFESQVFRVLVEVELELEKLNHYLGHILSMGLPKELEQEKVNKIEKRISEMNKEKEKIITNNL